ncbi:MAG: ATP-binding protein [Patescibacteria group bacterium]
MDDSIIIRKSPIVIIKDIIVVQILAVLTYLIVAIIADYGEIYRHLSFSQTLSYEIAKFIFVTLCEIILMGFVFFRWLFDTYTIYPDSIVNERGIIFKKKTIIPLNEPLSVKVCNSALSKILKYGWIEINDKKTGKFYTINHIISPEDFIRMLFNQKNQELLGGVISQPEDIYKILEKGEHEKLEFKSSFRWDIRENKLNRTIEQIVMKTIAAFLNTGGGHLIIGVDNNKNIIGLEYDYKSLPKQSADTFENHFTNVFREVIGSEHRLFVKLIFHSIDGKDVCVMRVLPSDKPAYIRADNNEAFYIRTGNSTTALKLSEVTPYIQSRWKKI